jgi:hypothetical protein
LLRVIKMGTKTKVIAGVGLLILLITGLNGIRPRGTLEVVYATEDGNLTVIPST